MKKVIRLTEYDLTKIVKQVMYEQQINESKKLKTLALTLGLTLNIGLSSCENKKDIKEKIPELKVLVKDQFTKANKTFKSFPHKFSSDNQNPQMDGYTDKVALQKIVNIKQFPNKNSNKWFIVIGVKQTIDDEVFSGYIINVYEEDKDGNGRFINSSLSLSQPPFTMDEVNKQIEHYQSHQTWDTNK